MNSRVTLSWPALVAAGFALLAAGAAGTYLLTAESRRASAVQSSPRPAPAQKAAAASGNATVTLTPEAMRKAGIELATATTGSGGPASVRIPGTVEANAYKEVVVTPLVAGRVTRVLAALGGHVRRGQTLLQVYSPELSDAQTKYLSAQAELAAHEQELARTGKLVTIGAASQQEMERLHAEHTAKQAGLQSLRSRLVLLGMSGPAIDALSPGTAVAAATDVPAPIAGVVTARDANAGLNVDTTTKVFTVVDLSSVWVVGALYERDFPRVRVGSTAVVTVPADPAHPRPGRVSYIDPQLNAETRTARVRVEVPNPGQQLRLGMYADIDIAGEPKGEAVLVPRTAVQSVGARQVVYVATGPGTFTEREVQLGEAVGAQVVIGSGLEAGERVASTGSFFVRAERERLGPASAPASSRTSPGPAPAAAPAAGAQAARITVGAMGFEPARVNLKAGAPARLTFVRTTDDTCATAVVFPGLAIRRELPLNQPVLVTFTPEKAGTIDFVCGVNMLRGTVVVAAE